MTLNRKLPPNTVIPAKIKLAGNKILLTLNRKLPQNTVIPAKIKLAGNNITDTKHLTQFGNSHDNLKKLCILAKTSYGCDK